MHEISITCFIPEGEWQEIEQLVHDWGCKDTAGTARALANIAVGAHLRDVIGVFSREIERRKGKEKDHDKNSMDG